MKRERNVRDFGAKGDNSTDDTAAIQAAYDALGSAGTLYFPSGTYKITSALNVGASGAFAHQIIGGTRMTTAGSGAPAAARIVQATANANIFDFTMNPLTGNSLSIDNLQLEYNSVGTGTAIYGDDSTYTTALSVKNCTIKKAGVGIRLQNQVCAVIDDVVTDSCDIGVLFVGNLTVQRFTNCRFETSATNALKISGFLEELTLENCVIEGTLGAGILIDASSSLWGFSMNHGWFENNATDCIRISGLTAGRSGQNWAFRNVKFDCGSQHAIRNTTAVNSGATVFELLFEACHFLMTTGRILTVDNLATSSGGPGYVDVTFLNCVGTGDIKGCLTPSYGGGVVLFNGSQGPTPANLVAGDAGTYPLFIDTGRSTNGIITTSGKIAFSSLTSTTADTNIYRVGTDILKTDDSFELDGLYIAMNQPAGFFQFLESGTTDAAAGPANTGRLYVRDNGAGKTQLCVRFNTGAVQVIATQP